MIQKILLLTIFTLGSFHLKGMEADRPSAPIGSSSAIPSELLINVVLAGVEDVQSIKEAGKFIANFAQTNRQFTNLINNQTNKNLIINALAQKIKTKEQANKELLDFANSREKIGSNIIEIIVKALLSAGADINAKNNTGTSALAKAAHFGRIDVVKELLAAGANPNDKDKDGMTVLMSAAFGSGDPETIKLLLAAGADVHAKDDSGETVLDYTSKPEAKKLIQEAMEKKK